MAMEAERRLCFEFKVINNLVRREIENSSNRQYIESVTGTNGWVIGYLIRNKDRDVFQRDLEVEFSIRRSTVSSILKRMEKNGLIRRETVAYDARLKKLVPTEKSYKINDLIMEDLAKVEKKLRNGLAEEDLKAFFKTADIIKTNLE